MLLVPEEKEKNLAVPLSGWPAQEIAGQVMPTTAARSETLFAPAALLFAAPAQLSDQEVQVSRRATASRAMPSALQLEEVPQSDCHPKEKEFDPAAAPLSATLETTATASDPAEVESEGPAFLLVQSQAPACPAAEVQRFRRERAWGRLLLWLLSLSSSGTWPIRIRIQTAAL